MTNFSEARPARKSGEERRRQILDTMLAMAGEEGIDRVTTKALAERVGVTEPALYRHFRGGKQDMWRSLASLLGARMQEGWRASLEGQRTPLERLRALVEAQLAFLAKTPAMPAIVFSRTLHRDNPALRAGVAEVGGRFHATLEQIIDDGRRAGELCRDTDPDAAAWLLISIVQGTALRWSLSEGAFDLASEGTRVLEVALRGLLSPTAEAGGEAKPPTGRTT